MVVVGKEIRYNCVLCDQPDLSYGEVTNHLVNEHSGELLTRILTFLNIKFNDQLLNEFVERI